MGGWDQLWGKELFISLFKVERPGEPLESKE